MKKIFFLLACVLMFGQIAYADTVTQFVFTTEPQTVGVSIQSETITIQSQNSSGISEDITETHDVVFTSTSPTGQFLSTSGNPVTTTMSKNTSNKNFLYKDSTTGTHTLQITATGRNSLQSYSTSQQIIVGGPATATSTATATTTNTTPSGGSSSGSTSSTVVIYSAHSSPAPLSGTEYKAELEISAGRDRLTSVGTSITFQAIPTKLQNISAQNVIYQWSFGDGVVGYGNIVNHAYRFPGEYAVVVNAGAPDKQAVSRLTVRVVSPVFSLVRVPEGIEILNKSGVEINLEGWSLVSKEKIFIFPKDTLIGAGKKVTFADEITGLNSGSADLVNPMNKSFAMLASEISSALVSNTSPSLENIQAKIDEVKTTLAKISPVQKVVTPVVTITKPSAPLVSEPVLAEASSSQSTNVATVFEATKQTGFVGRIFSWPIKGFNFIRSIFIED